MEMTDAMLGSAALLLAAVALREIHGVQARRLARAHQEDLRLAVVACQEHIRRLAQDLFVVHALLVERQVLRAGDITRARARLLDGASAGPTDDGPAPTAAAREPPAYLVADDAGERNLH